MKIGNSKIAISLGALLVLLIVSAPMAVACENQGNSCDQVRCSEHVTCTSKCTHVTCKETAKKCEGSCGKEVKDCKQGCSGFKNKNCGVPCGKEFKICKEQRCTYKGKVVT
jgi:hypothetical protein